MRHVLRAHVRPGFALRATVRQACFIVAALVLLAELPGTAHRQQGTAAPVTITLVRWPFT
jgi:hypothetical protein